MEVALLFMLSILVGSPNTLEPAGVQKGQPGAAGRPSRVTRTTKLLDYRRLSSPARIDLRGTALLPQAHGTAELLEKNGDFDVDAEFQNLQSASKFGSEYLTYVMWAVTPQGRSINLGEALPEGARKLKVTTDLKTFGLVVTAEPYMAVTEPSDLVVMESAMGPDTVGVTELDEVSYPLLPRGFFASAAGSARALPIVPESDVPLQVYEAQNAIRIARATSADRYAPESFRKAVELLQEAEDDLKRNIAKKTVAKEAREAAETAEDARVISIRWMDDARAGNQRRRGN